MIRQDIGRWSVTGMKIFGISIDPEMIPFLEAAERCIMLYDGTVEDPVLFVLDSSGACV